MLLVIVIALLGWALYLDIRTLIVYSITGHPGPRGDQGILGQVGAKGLGGPRGLVGPWGPTGPLGVTGPSGPFGPTGPRGPTGSTGPVGETGFPASVVIGPVGPTGALGTAVVGPAGFASLLIGPTGNLGPTASRINSSLGITWSGVTGQLGPSVTTVFTPGSFLTPNFAVESSYVVGPHVSNSGGSASPLPTLETLGMRYRISATLIATLSTTQSISNLRIPLQCQLTLTASRENSTPQILTSETILIAPNQDTPTYSVNMRVTTVHPPLEHISTRIGFNAVLQCADIHAPSGTLLVSMATLTIVPVF